ncbi:Probable CCR4-associated factor 1 homolog 9 [Linum perenne]
MRAFHATKEAGVEPDCQSLGLTKKEQACGNLGCSKNSSDAELLCYHIYVVLVNGWLDEFLDIVRVFFGVRVYDVKHLMKFGANFYGGLDRTCTTLGVKRVTGNSHQAGSDSLATLHAFQKMREMYFSDKEGAAMEKYANVLYGLELLASS